jgi:hypothetical protein
LLDESGILPAPPGKLSVAYKKADDFARNVRTIQVLIDRDTILSGTLDPTLLLGTPLPRSVQVKDARQLTL